MYATGTDSFKMEKIFNIFPIFEGDLYIRIGFRVHEMEGTDEEKINFLLSRIEQDITEMALVDLPENFTIKLPNGTEIIGLTLDSYNTLLYNGTDGILYEPIFQLFDAPEYPLSVSTSIVDGQVKIDKSIYFETTPKAPFTEKLHEEMPNYYLSEFMTDEGFEMDKMIDHDFFNAIRLLFNHKHFVSCLKLLMSAIDSIAFLEYGDVANKNIFKNWLIEYCDFSTLNISEDELWEYRNSILHMTNSYSRKVNSKKVSPLQFYVSAEDKPDLISDVESKYFNLKRLISVISDGISKWAESFNENRGKFAGFCDRYDLIVSDSRYRKLKM